LTITVNISPLFMTYWFYFHVSRITQPFIFSYQRKLIGAILRLNKATLTVIKKNALENCPNFVCGKH